MIFKFEMTFIANKKMVICLDLLLPNSLYILHTIIIKLNKATITEQSFSVCAITENIAWVKHIS